MKEDTDGEQAAETQQHAQGQEDDQTQHQAADSEVLNGAAGGNEDFKALLAKQEARIKELEGQVAEAAQTKANADRLSAEIEQVKAQAAEERVDFQLRLAGVRNVKAARALLADHEGDVTALKAAEPWLFSDAKPQDQAGTTGLEPAGVATKDDNQMRRWRKLAGLDDERE